MKKAAAAFLLFLLPASPALAQAAAPAEARLYQDAGGAVIAIRLAPGFKTYWRMPGETGVAPRFSWEGSENLQSAEVAMPAPRRYADPEGETVGYAAQVLWPVRITPKDAALPVRLKLQLDYAVCEKLCIPLKADLQAEPAAPGLVAAAEAGLPGRLEGASARLAPGGLEVALPVEAEDIFVEQNAALAYFRKPGAKGPGRYLVPAEGDISALPGKSVDLTLISRGAGYVTTVTVE